MVWPGDVKTPGGDRDARLLQRIGDLALAHYQLCFLVAAERSGLLSFLRDRPRDLPAIARALSVGLDEAQALAAWLDVGVSAGLLHRRGDTYVLSAMAARLAADRCDPLLACMEDMLAHNARLIQETPERLRRGRRFSPADTNVETAARSAQLLEPAIAAEVEAFVPRMGRRSLLCLGCGSGVFQRAALMKNLDLRVVVLDCPEQGCVTAWDALERFGLRERARGDPRGVFDYPLGERFDLAMMHGVLPLHPEERHAELLAKVHASLVPGGRLLVTQLCRGGSPTVEIISLNGAMTEGRSVLPDPEELIGALGTAGFSDVRAKNLLASLDRMFAFTAQA